jgi:hypothetical protein
LTVIFFSMIITTVLIFKHIDKTFLTQFVLAQLIFFVQIIFKLLFVFLWPFFNKTTLLLFCDKIGERERRHTNYGHYKQDILSFLRVAVGGRGEGNHYLMLSLIADMKRVSQH